MSALLLRRLAQSASPAAAAAAAADPHGAGRLLRAAEAAKVRLSSCGAAEVALRGLVASPGDAGDVGGGLVDLETVVTGDDLLEATVALRARLWPPLASAAEQCKLAFASDGAAFERRLARGGGGAGEAGGSGSGSSSSGSPSAVATPAAPAATAATAVADKYAPKPRVATAAVLVGGATRMPVVRDYVRHVTGLEPR